MIGKRISHYEIQEKLGEGGMGVVYKAHDTKLNRTVALKFLPPDLTRDQEAIDRFINEAQAASSLDHANICTIYEIDETEDGQLYIAMACYAGETLEKKVSSEQLPVDSAIDIAMQAAQGLSRAHEAGIVHRDIKPSNLIITPRGEVKIIDFGLAKLTEPAQFTKTGRLSGTVAYMSPEQVQGQPIDHRADIWSLGVVLYQMLTGKPPFQGENEAEVIYSVVNEIPLSISEYRKDVSVGLSRIVNKTLGKNRDARHHHVADLLDDLKLERKEQFETINLPAQKTNKSKNRKLSYLAAILIILISAAIGAYSMLSRFSKGPDQSSSSNHLVLAVLPFENLATTEDEYFVDGMTDEIASYLTAASDIVVISQTSASQYKDTKKSAKQIGEELNVDYILRGSFRWHELKEGQKKLRVAPQLIDVRNDTHLWARTYDFAIEEVFDVQANIAREVATALNTAFVEAEHRAAVSGFSLDIEAYDYYLRGNEYFERPGVKFQNMILACQMYEKSVHKDPAFATAFARLSLAYTALAAHYSDSLAYYSNRAKKTAFQALVLEPDLALARRALGMYYYQVEGNFVKALEELTIAQRLQPNESTVLAAIGFIFRRQGNYRDALGFLQQSLSLDPRSASRSMEVALTLHRMRHYAEVEQFYDRAIALSPDWGEPYRLKIRMYLAWYGNTDRAWEIIKDTPLELSPMFVGWHPLWYNLYVLDKNYDMAITEMKKTRNKQGRIGHPFYYTALAAIYEFADDVELVKVYYDSAKYAINFFPVNDKKDAAHTYALLGIVHAGLGEKDEAIRLGKKAIEMIPLSDDSHYWGTYLLEYLAWIYTMVGEHDLAVDQLEKLLSAPGYISVRLIRSQPMWKPLQNHPRFKALVETNFM